MEGKQDIERLHKDAICFKGKANEIIDYCNLPWDAKMPEDGFGTVTFKAGDNKITLDMSNLKTFDIKVCDDDGNMQTIRILGFAVAST